MKVEYLEHMGNDLSVVNAARVSFDKVSEEFSDNDAGLIRYLVRHEHWTPFGHTAVKFRIKAPIFVARQMGKHQVGFVWNEVSRRYVATEPEFFMPNSWRKSAANVKQGSSDETIETFTASDGCLNAKPSFLDDIIGIDVEQGSYCDTCFDTTRIYTYSVNSVVEYVHNLCREAYNLLLEEGVCPEQARMILPQSMYTQWVWTGNVASIARTCKLRLDPHTQLETRWIAQEMSDIMAKLFPVSWEALMA